MNVKSMGETTAILPIRAGSKGLPRKNIADLAGRPLYEHTIEQARAADIGKIIITTDISEVLNRRFSSAITVLHRPAELCQDHSTMDSVVLHAIESTIASDSTIILLQATSPLRRPEDILRAYKLYKTGLYDLVLTVTDADPAIQKYGRCEGDSFIPLVSPKQCFMNRNELSPVVKPNGAVYVFSSDWFLRNKSFATDNIGCVKMPAERSVDIDNSQDLDMVVSFVSEA